MKRFIKTQIARIIGKKVISNDIIRYRVVPSTDPNLRGQTATLLNVKCHPYLIESRSLDEEASINLTCKQPAEAATWIEHGVSGRPGRESNRGERQDSKPATTYPALPSHSRADLYVGPG